jgi:hypothetical protein
MRKHLKRRGVAGVVLLSAALFTLALAGPAQAKLTGEYTKFAQCPYKTEGVNRCLWSQTTGGEVVLGSKTVPIVSPAVLQGGFTKPAKEGAEQGFSKFFAAKNGETLTKAPQKVPGGLAGFVKCNEISIGFIRVACEAVFENGVTGVNSTLELARPATDIRVSELNLALGEGVTLKLPVRAHLENPFLGSECYVGSSGSPLQWELRTDTTAPPPPNKPITGNPGEIEFLEEGTILEVKGAVLVDNAWSAPSASGCGGIFSFIINPIVNSSSGLPSAAGKNTAILKNRILEATAFAVRSNDEANP